MKCRPALQVSLDADGWGLKLLRLLRSGVIRYRGARIQLLDLPGIIEGAKDGKGRGRQVHTSALRYSLNEG